eukprot:1556556-Karenia_brevis.AAC.1
MTGTTFPCADSSGRVALPRSCCSPVPATLVLSMLPMIAQATHLAHIPATTSATAVTILSAVCSMAWYLTGASTAYSAVKAVLVIMDTAVQGMEDVVDEVVQGSRLV